MLGNNTLPRFAGWSIFQSTDEVHISFLLGYGSDQAPQSFIHTWHLWASLTSMNRLFGAIPTLFGHHTPTFRGSLNIFLVTPRRNLYLDMVQIHLWHPTLSASTMWPSSPAFALLVPSVFTLSHGMHPYVPNVDSGCNHQTTHQGDWHSLNIAVGFCAQGIKGWKIWSVMHFEECNTLHETFNWWFDTLFAEDCHDSNSHLYHVCQGKLGMGLVVSYLSKFN